MPKKRATTTAAGSFKRGARVDIYYVETEEGAWYSGRVKSKSSGVYVVVFDCDGSTLRVLSEHAEYLLRPRTGKGIATAAAAAAVAGTSGGGGGGSSSSSSSSQRC